MDNRDKIIAELYIRSDIHQLCMRRGKNWADQLKSEAFLELCELPKEEFNKRVDEKRLTRWLIRTIINISYESSNFSKNIKGIRKGIKIYDIDQMSDIVDPETCEMPIENDYCEADLLKGVDHLEFFHNDIIKNYLKYGNNIRKTAWEMGINREYVGKLVKESNKQIEEYLKRSIEGN